MPLVKFGVVVHQSTTRSSEKKIRHQIHQNKLSRAPPQQSMLMFGRALLAFCIFAVANADDDAEAYVQANIASMNDASSGFDVIVVCTSTKTQAQYWENRLIATKGGSIAPNDAIIVGVDEDWSGKAGNGMGTLYAFVKAAAELKRRSGMDLAAKLAAGEVSVAIYHTAGKGTRLAPIHLAENSNKPGNFAIHDLLGKLMS
jgi:hypothetical protein